MMSVPTDISERDEFELSFLSESHRERTRQNTTASARAMSLIPMNESNSKISPID